MLTRDDPFQIRGCTVTRIGDNAWRIESSGPLGGDYATFFSAEGAHAKVLSNYREGRFGGRNTYGLPPTRHSAVLKDLGFRTISYQHGHAHPLR
jgi:hypothetical protein